MGKMKVPFLLMCAPKHQIRNADIPSCKSCIHYEPGYTYAKCKMFGEKNIITSEVRYDFADSCREKEEKCGKMGKFHEESWNTEVVNNVKDFCKSNPALLGGMLAFLFSVITASILQK